MTVHHVSRLTRGLLALAVDTLPAGHRERYRSELYAELHDVPGDQHARYALQVLLNAPALRAALAATPAPAPVAGPRKPLRCRLGRHDWETEYNEDGEKYQACHRCPAERDSITLIDHSGSINGLSEGGHAGF